MQPSIGENSSAPIKTQKPLTSAEGVVKGIFSDQSTLPDGGDRIFLGLDAFKRYCKALDIINLYTAKPNGISFFSGAK